MERHIILMKMEYFKILNDKKVYFLMSLFISISFLVMPCFCDAAEEYKKVVHERTEYEINKTERNDILYSWKGSNERKKINSGTVKVAYGSIESKKYPTPIGAEYTTVTYSSVKMPIYKMDAVYVVKTDSQGRRAIAYIDSNTNEPVIATYGFYVFDRVDPNTHVTTKVKYCIDGTGYIVTGWFVEQNNTRYYLSESDLSFGEAMIGNKIFSDGKTYSFNEEGILHEFELKDKSLIIEE